MLKVNNKDPMFQYFNFQIFNFEQVIASWENKTVMFQLKENEVKMDAWSKLGVISSSFKGRYYYKLLFK